MYGRRDSMHELLTDKTILPYLSKTLPDFANDNCTVEEIGDGNINYVFRVTDKNNQRRLIVKQADKLLRSSGRPLDIKRAVREGRALERLNEVVPNYTPKIYAVDEEMAIIIMEDISEYRNLRHVLSKCQQLPQLANDLSEFLAVSLVSSTDLVMEASRKQLEQAFYSNVEMREISEDLVFTEPYNNQKQRNQIFPGNEAFVQKHLYEHEALIMEVASLRYHFMNHGQALLHGDLHSGSIFVSQNGLKVIDPEFAFYGPAGYDIGNVVAHLLLAFYHQLAQDSVSLTYLSWLRETIIGTLIETEKKMSDYYEKEVTLSLYRTSRFKQEWLKGIICDTYGYTGTEMIRRVVGDTKVAEVTTIEDRERRLDFERAVITLSEKLILDRHTMTSDWLNQHLQKEIDKYETRRL